MSVTNVFTKNFVRKNLPRLPSDSQLRLYTGEAGGTDVFNYDSTTPMVFKLDRVGDLALIEDLDLKAETFRATLIVDTEPSMNAVWWFSTDNGTTKERIRIVQRQTGSFGYFYSIVFQVVS